MRNYSESIQADLGSFSFMSTQEPSFIFVVGIFGFFSPLEETVVHFKLDQNTKKS